MAHADYNNKYILEINTLLAQRFLHNNQAKEALTLLTESVMQQSAMHYKYLLTKSKTYFQLNEMQKALKLANESKTKANEFWSLEDENYLQSIKNN